MSGRPATPPPSSAALPCSAAGQASTQASTYSPSLFDLVYAYGHNKVFFEGDLPSTFLESASVDGARKLGAGASFTASIRTLPEGPKLLSSTTSHDGLIITKTQPAPVRPKFVVFKVANVGFDSRGYPLPQYKAALQSVLTEFHALLYPSLLKHPNVVNVLGLAWGTNPFDPEQRLPALVLEYADQGTLSDVLKRGSPSSAEKRGLCFDVACGLQALHDTGLVHGDVKADNVLCFGSSGRRMAKLGDFGFAVVGESESAEIWLGGTRPWQAPEVQHAIPVSEARFTDVYSFGLLVWSTAIGGDNMFRRFCTSDEPAEKWDEEIEEFKTTDLMRQLSHTSTWFSIHLTKTMESNPANAQAIHIAEALNSVGPELARVALQQASTAFVAKDELLNVMDEVLSATLDMQPSKRSLETALKVLRPFSLETTTREQTAVTFESTRKGILAAQGLRNSIPPVNSEKPVDSTSPNHTRLPVDSPSDRAISSEDIVDPTTMKESQPSWSRRGFKHAWLSWQNMRDLAPALQAVVFQAYAQREADEDDAPGLFLLCSFLINGYGHSIDDEHACKVLRRSADLGNPNARAYLYRLHICLGILSVPGEDITQYLRSYGLHGFRVARNGYGSVVPREDTLNHIRLYMDAWGGVGADWYGANNMLHGLTQSEWIKDDFLISQAASLANVTEYRVNKRGDTLLHFAAACGRTRSLKVLLDEHNFDVNIRNSAGDTPLICACRSGQYDATMVLLEGFHADASLSSNYGETALHWLCGMVSYFDYSIPKLAQSMIAHGADIEARTMERVCHAHIEGTIDADFQMPGTALAWAVHDNRPHVVKALLELGAQANDDKNPHVMSPLSWAAFYHHHECLRFIIEALENRQKQQYPDDKRKADGRYTIMYGPLHRHAVHAADRFSMILRTGMNYLRNLRSTLDLLREKAKLINFSKQFGGNDQTLFYFAVAEAHDDVVSYMLEHDWHTKDINTPCGALLRTPVLEAVRWCRMPLVELLVKNGADIKAQGANPYYPEIRNWSALHILAHEGHNTDSDAIVARLLSHGLHIDGGPYDSNAIHGGSTLQGNQEAPNITVEEVGDKFSQVLTISESKVETPLSCALRSNAFKLCDALIKHEASTTALSLSSGLHQVAFATTILGHIVISNTRYSLPRLRYLLGQHASDPDHLFVVEPERALSVLHRAAMANDGVRTTFGTVVEHSDFDMTTNHEILCELLKHFGSAKFVNAKCALGGKTALMLAVGLKNLGAAQTLIHNGADIKLTDDDGLSAFDYAKGVAESSGEQLRAEWRQVLTVLSSPPVVDRDHSYAPTQQPESVMG